MPKQDEVRNLSQASSLKLYIKLDLGLPEIIQSKQYLTTATYSTMSSTHRTSTLGYFLPKDSSVLAEICFYACKI